MVTTSIQQYLPLHADWLQHRSHRSWLKKATMCISFVQNESNTQANADFHHSFSTLCFKHFMLTELLFFTSREKSRLLTMLQEVVLNVFLLSVRLSDLLWIACSNIGLMFLRASLFCLLSLSSSYNIQQPFRFERQVLKTDTGRRSSAHGPSEINRSASCPRIVRVRCVRSEPAIRQKSLFWHSMWLDCDYRV
jgi:hypothetical protein